MRHFQTTFCVFYHQPEIIARPYRTAPRHKTLFFTILVPLLVRGLSAVLFGQREGRSLSSEARRVQYLEDLEDRAIVKDKLSRLMKHPLEAGAIPWEEAREAW